ncbi:MAG TPA: DUF1015 domain-containing protein [Solirubrobacteraceae bacterium]|nr:DUF1015 domain-containing protein [Solirubrobacteraceae bacterium]
MADVEPLRALHYDPAVVGPLADVVAPPYDVLDAEGRAAYAARSPYNVVAVDLPSLDLPQAGAAPGGDPYAHAAEIFAAWQREGALVRDAEPAIWAHAQDYTGPDGIRRTRRGFFCRVRLQEYGPGRVRPHERTHPGPREDRLRLMRATRADTSPIFSLYSDPAEHAWRALEPATAAPPWGEATDADGTAHRLWRVADPAAIAAVQAATRDAELLIADGHHRYETALAYAREVDAGGTGGEIATGATGGSGTDPAVSEPDHRYLLMCLVALQDPGLTVFPTHRVVKAADAAALERLGGVLRRDFDLAEVPLDQLAPPPGAGPLQLGYIDARRRRPVRAVLRDQAIADAALAGHCAAYRQLDTGVLEALLLKGALGLSDEDISHLHGIRYARDAAEATALVLDGDWDAAFLMRPTPVEQVREVAAAGENMPPKSTYFYPKLLTGLLFNPL